MASDAPVQGEVRLSEEEALERLRAMITYDRKQGDLAEELGVSRAYVSAVLTGKKAPSDKMLALAGLVRRVEIYLVD